MKKEDVLAALGIDAEAWGRSGLVGQVGSG